MLNPIRLCNDLFADEALSDLNLRIFAEEHLVRLTDPDNNPGGIYNTLITDTTAKYNAFYGKVTNELVKKATAEGTTITRNNARQAVYDKIVAVKGLVIYKFGETSAQFQDFFPIGLEEYHNAREGEVGALFERFRVKAVLHLTADFPAEVTAYTNLVNSFQTAFAAREAVVVQLDSAATGRHQDRKTLTMQLTKNLLTIATANIDNADKFDDYFNTTYLPITREADEPLAIAGAVPMGAIVNIDLSSLGTGARPTKIKFFNPGASTLRYYFSNSPAGFPAALFVDVAPGEVVEKEPDELDAGPGNTYLNVQNTGTTPGNYKVEFFT